MRVAKHDVVKKRRKGGSSDESQKDLAHRLMHTQVKKSASTVLDILRSVRQVRRVAEKAKFGKSAVRLSIGLARFLALELRWEICFGEGRQLYSLDK